MKTELMIVTFKRDFIYLAWCLKSISKFSRGFEKLNVLIPAGDRDSMTVLLSSVVQTHPLPFPILIRTYDEWPEKGMLHHLRQIMYADEWCNEADFIAHMDADCIFTNSVTPEYYIKEERPILRYERFDKIGRRHPGAAAWQKPTQQCLPFPVLYETMRCHPEVYHRGLYKEARELMERHTGKPVDDYIKVQRNAFPQTFCEFNTLGNVAIKRFPSKYVLVEQSGDVVTPDNALQQFWSHGPIDKPQNIWVKGHEHNVIPLEFIKQIGI